MEEGELLAPASAVVAASPVAHPSPSRAPRIVSLRVLPFYPPSGAFGTDLFDPSVQGQNPEIIQPVDVHVMAVIVGVSQPSTATAAAPKVHLVVTTGGHEPGGKTSVLLDRAYPQDTGWGAPRASIVTLVRVNGCPYITFKASLIGLENQRPEEKSIGLRCGPE